MPGMGGGPFGHGPFGHFDWARRVLWLDIPARPDREKDKEHGNVLQSWQTAMGEIFQNLLRAAQGSASLRDPEELRTRFQDSTPLTILSSAVESGGRSVRVTVNDPAPLDPWEPIGDISVGWTLVDVAGVEFLVDEVHKESNAIIVVGTSLPAAGAATATPPTMLGHLGYEFGIDLDESDPEHFQRISVRDAWQWYRRKGAQVGYQIIGDIFGHTVTAQRLWYVGATAPASIPAAYVFEYPAGSGLYFTTYPPTRPLFDEVAADVVPLDYYCWEAPLWTTSVIEPPLGPLPDGTLVRDAIGSTMQGLPIVAVAALGSNLYRVRVTGDLTPVASAGLGSPRWYATFPAGDAGDFWLEATPVDLGGGDWTFDVYSSVAAPAWGATANIDYQCDPQPDCSFCAASALLIDITPADILTETGVIWEQMIPRILAKVRRGIPIHIKVVMFRYIAPPIAAPFMVSGVHFIATV